MNFFRALMLAREILSWGQEIADLLESLGRAWHEGREDELRVLARVVQREQAAGRARKRAEELARPPTGPNIPQ